MTELIGTEGGLLIMAGLILFGSILMYIVTGRPRLRFLILLDLSLTFWIASYSMNLLTSGPQMTGVWQIISLMGMTLVLFSFVAAFVDYMKDGNRY